MNTKYKMYDFMMLHYFLNESRECLNEPGFDNSEAETEVWSNILPIKITVQLVDENSVLVRVYNTGYTRKLLEQPFIYDGETLDFVMRVDFLLSRLPHSYSQKEQR